MRGLLTMTLAEAEARLRALPEFGWLTGPAGQAQDWWSVSDILAHTPFSERVVRGWLRSGDVQWMELPKQKGFQVARSSLVLQLARLLQP